MRLKSTEVSLEELERLVEQAGREPLSAEDQGKLQALVETLKTLVEELEADNLTIEQARALLGDEAEE